MSVFLQALQLIAAAPRYSQGGKALNWLELVEFQSSVLHVLLMVYADCVQMWLHTISAAYTDDLACLQHFV